MRTIVAGSRSFTDFTYLQNSLAQLNITTIISGGAIGADKLGEYYAKKYSIPLEVFPAEWDKYGKSAGYLRNQQMAKHAQALAAFWDGKSKGTQHMINIARIAGLRVDIFLF